jgi:opacity protein-like surface antigen
MASSLLVLKSWKIGGRMKFILIPIAVLLAMQVLLHAEKPSGSTEITIYSGVSFLEAERVAHIPLPFFRTRESLDGGFLIGFKGAYFLNDNIGIEGNFSVAPNQTLSRESTFECPPGVICPAGPVVPFFFEERDVSSYYYDANFVYSFPQKYLTPFVTFGIGGVTTDTSEFRGITPNIERGNQTDFSINFGGGAKVYFNRFGLRFEVNDHVVADHFITEETEHDLQVQYGFLFRF